MSNQSPTARTLAAARRQTPRLELIEWHSISVVRYVGGEARAWHNRLDLGTRKLVCDRLCDPSDPSSDLPWDILALTNAAEELEVAHRMKQGLW